MPCFNNPVVLKEGVSIVLFVPSKGELLKNRWALGMLEDVLGLGLLGFGRCFGLRPFLAAWTDRTAHATVVRFQGMAKSVRSHGLDRN